MSKHVAFLVANPGPSFNSRLRVLRFVFPQAVLCTVCVTSLITGGLKLSSGLSIFPRFCFIGSQLASKRPSDRPTLLNLIGDTIDQSASHDRLPHLTPFDATQRLPFT